MPIAQAQIVETTAGLGAGALTIRNHLLAGGGVGVKGSLCVLLPVLTVPWSPATPRGKWSFRQPWLKKRK